MLTLAVLLPIAAGFILLAVRPASRRAREIAVEGVTVLTSLLTLFCILNPDKAGSTMLWLTAGLPIRFAVDGLARIFMGIIAFLWPLATLYGFEYMEHEGGENHFFAFYTVSYGVTLGIASAANLMTLYVFYEFLTLCTMPLVMHGSSHESLAAGRQYMRYSFGGAALAFVGVMLVTICGQGGAFRMGGVLGEGFAERHSLLLQVGYLCMFLGFGVKAAIFPLHAWLPSASIAPTPVTALLHAVAVVKSGVFAVLRMTYYSVGAQLLRGTPAQGIAMALACATIVYGSTMAVREHHFKRRLAYSTVSNLSYIIMAGTLMTQAGYTAAMTHMVFHAVIKITLFFTAGAVLVKTERSQVEQLRGLGKVMPKLCLTYTVGALALTGTPFLPGFVSKWLIGTAAVGTGTWYGYMGVAAILISAVLTAIYLLGPMLSMWTRPLDESQGHAAAKDPGLKMLLPFAVLCAAIVAMGLGSGAVVSVLTRLTAGVL